MIRALVRRVIAYADVRMSRVVMLNPGSIQARRALGIRPDHPTLGWAEPEGR